MAFTFLNMPLLINASDNNYVNLTEMEFNWKKKKFACLEILSM